MYDDLFPRERTLSLSQSTQRPYTPPEVGTFQGFGSALADSIPYAGLTAASAWTAVLDAYGKAAAYRDAPAAAALAGRPAPDMAQVQAQTIDRMGDSTAARGFRERAGDFAPNPAEVGVAGQIVHGVASSLIKAGAYSLTGPAAPVLFGADVGINRAQELTDKGVDGGTAALTGVASGVAGAVGMRLPAALGATRLQSAGIGAVVNPVLNVAEVGGIHALLDHADYGQIAAQYQPFDPLTLTVSALTGAGFGAAFHAKAGGAKPTLTPDEHAAVLTMNEVKTLEGDTLARAGDAQAANVASDAQAQARAQMDAGELVSVASHVQADPAQVVEARRATFERAVEDLRADLLADAGNRAEPGDIPAARAQLAQLQHDIERERVQADSAFRAEAKAQQRRGLSRKEAEAAARDTIGQRRADMQAQADRLANIIDSNRRAAQAEQDLAVLNRGGIPERYARLFDGPHEHDRAEPLAGPAQTADVPQAVPSTRPVDTPAAHIQAAMAEGIESPGFVQKMAEAVGALLGKQAEAPLARRADTPEQAQALEIAARNPDAMIHMDDGAEVRVADLLAHADQVEATAKTETAAFEAAVNCALRFPQ
ncbi:hypothetical protein CCAE64S_02446 [Castellaniella caeni]